MTGRTRPTHVQGVPGCPRGVSIYRIPGSRFWQVRVFSDGRYVRKSTHETSLPEARENARELYKDILLADRSDVAIHPTTFHAASEQFLKRQQLQVDLGRLDRRSQDEDKKKLRHDILPFFQSLDVKNVSSAKLDEYLSVLARRKLSKSTLNKHVVLLRKILRYAAEQGHTKALPRFPRIGVDNNARPYFDLNAYRKLSSTATRYANNGYQARYSVKGHSRVLKYDMDFADFIVFHVNVFIRLSDIKELRHRHVKVEKGRSGTYLEIFPPHSKTTDRSSISLERAVEIYERLLRRHKAVGFGGPDDYIFYPEYKNRTYALDVIRRLFLHILDKTGLRHDERGRPRTLYSLRHTALMFRFLYGNNISVFLLARNALTSVEMLERFYLSHAESKMRIRELQSFKPGIPRRLYKLKRGAAERLERTALSRLSPVPRGY